MSKTFEALNAINLFIFVYVCLILVTAVKSGKIFHKIRDDLRHIRDEIKCDLHQVGNLIHAHGHHHDPCQKHDVNTTVTKHVDDNFEPEGRNIGRVIPKTERVIPVTEQNVDAYQPLIDVRFKDDNVKNVNVSEDNEIKRDTVISLETSTVNGTASSSPIVLESRRMIVAKSNCKPGFRVDRSGRCREDYS